MLEDIINKMINDDNYVKVFTRDRYDSKFVDNCNETFKNKCIIFSPKITYGIDIQIEYETVYAIYSGNSINGYLMLQQISRCRKCKEIKILSFYDNNVNLNNNENNKYVMKYTIYKNIYINTVQKTSNNKVRNMFNDNVIAYLKTNKLNDDDIIMKYVNTIINTQYYSLISGCNKLISFSILSEFQGYTVNIYYEDNKYFNDINVISTKKMNSSDILEIFNLQKTYDYFKKNNSTLELDILDNMCKQSYLDKIIRSKWLFSSIVKNGIDKVLEIFNDKSIIECFLYKTIRDNAYDNYVIINDYIKTFKVSVFELCETYDKKLMSEFVKNHKREFNNVIKNFNYQATSNKIHNSNTFTNNKIIGLYYFNELIMSCYHNINRFLITKERYNQRYKNEDIRIARISLFDYRYINGINNIFNHRKDYLINH